MLMNIKTKERLGLGSEIKGKQDAEEQSKIKN